MAAPVLVFAFLLAALQWIAGARTWLPVQTVAVYAALRLLLLALPLRRLLALPERRSRWWTPALLVFFVRHFLSILGAEARRAVIARSIAVRRRYGPGAFRSLAWSLASLLRRTLARAERFYAAQWLRGLSQ
jgi:archaellum biogenesis protein FlaJ (TadC family)